jgi:hypothetical protein
MESKSFPSNFDIAGRYAKHLWKYYLSSVEQSLSVLNKIKSYEKTAPIAILKLKTTLIYVGIAIDFGLK